MDPEQPFPLRQPFLGRETSRLDEAASLRHPLLDADTTARRQVSAGCCSGILMLIVMLIEEYACHRTVDLYPLFLDTCSHGGRRTKCAPASWSTWRVGL